MKVEEEARQAVDGKRQEEYGTPAVNHQRTTWLWSAYLSAKYGIAPDGSLDPENLQDGIANLTEEDVCNLNILQKMSREMNSHTRDGLVDQIGYVINVAKLRGYE